MTAAEQAEAQAVEEELERLWAEGAVVALDQGRDGQLRLLPQHAERLRRWGPAVLIGSGGSSGARSGGRRCCLQPLAHLRQSAEACGAWLRDLGIDPAGTVLVNPLPLHHVSGLLPLVRSRLWGVPLLHVTATQMRQPATLAAALPPPGDRQALLSLVPTQLHRLLADPAGVVWLRGFAVIWLGGAGLDPGLAAAARAEGIRLSPCFGATETAAMVAALPPDEFLAGQPGCGRPLADVELRLAAGTAIEVRTPRLSPGWLSEDGSGLQPLDGPDGWWRSGDAGRLDPAGLQVLGRLDGAIHSGGETVFPEQVEQRLRGLASAAGLPLADLLLLPVRDPLWGERLVALVRPLPAEEAGADQSVLEGLIALARRLPPAERPMHWWTCTSLVRTDSGKWQRPRWVEWLRQQQEINPVPR